MKDVSEDDKKTYFHTGLQTRTTFLTVYYLCKPGVILTSGTVNRCKLLLKQQFLLVSMHHRLNLNEQGLAYHFHLSRTSVSVHFHKWIDVIFVRLYLNFMTRKK